MPDGTPASGGKYRMTRRGLLAAAAVSAVAGCRSIDGVGAGRERTIRAFDLPDVDGDSVLGPVVAPSVPVDIDPAYVASTRERVTGLLAELPVPLGPEDIPNGHVRERLTDAADAATDGLDEARTARTDLVALQAHRSARAHARFAAAGWAVADSGLSVDPLRGEHRQVVAEARTAREDHEYVGTDLVRSTLVHARVEGSLDRVIDAGQPRVHDEGELLTVAEWGETAERGQAYLDDARHLDTQFTASLPDDVGTVDGTLTRAAETLAGDARSRRSDLPPEPTADEWGLVERVVHALRREVDRGPDRIADAPGPAAAVVDLTERLAGFRALDRVRERVDAGEIARPESAEAVRNARTTAHDALEAALADSPSSELARTVLSDVSWRVSRADRELTRYRGDITPSRLDGVMENYIVVTAMAQATPAACRQTGNTLESVQ